MTGERWRLTPYLAVLLPVGAGLGLAIGWWTGDPLSWLAIGAGVAILLALLLARWRWESPPADDERRAP